MQPAPPAPFCWPSPLAWDALTVALTKAFTASCCPGGVRVFVRPWGPSIWDAAWQQARLQAPLFLWRDSETETAFAAWGDAHLESQLGSMPLDLALGDAPLPEDCGSLPRLWTAQPFAPMGPAGGNWGTLRDGLAITPEWQLACFAGQAFASWHAARPTQSAPAAAAQAWVAQFQVAYRRMRLSASASSAAAPSPGAVPEPPQAPAPHAWLQAVARAQAAMREGQPPLEKVVLARAIAVDAPEGTQFCPYATLQALDAAKARGISFLVVSAAGEPAFVGATPEVLVRLSQRRLITHAVAGTRPRGETAEADAAYGRALYASSKERHEHALVVDAILTALRPLAASVDAPKTPLLLKLAHLQHLVTPIAAEISPGVTLATLVRALHPTPAVGGVPKEAALAWLIAHEPLDRGLYAGPLGYVDGAGGGTVAVAIRSLAMTPRRAHLYVGAGIVPGSEALAEYRETALKAQASRQGLRTLLRPDLAKES